MKKYKYYILAAIFAVLLTLLQIFISKAMIEKDKGYLYVSDRDFVKGEHIKEGDIRKIEVFGYTSSYTIDENKVCISDMPKGVILTEQMFIDAKINQDLRIVCLMVDKSRCPSTMLSESDNIDLFIIPDNKSISLYESEWMNKILKVLKIEYDMDNDIGFMIKNLSIASLSYPESSNYSIYFRVIQPVDQLLAFLKNRSTIDIILPIQYWE